MRTFQIGERVWGRNATSRRITYRWRLSLPLDFRLWHSKIWELQRCVSSKIHLERVRRVRTKNKASYKTASHSRSICCQCHFEISMNSRRFPSLSNALHVELVGTHLINEVQMLLLKLKWVWLLNFDYFVFYFSNQHSPYSGVKRK